MGRNIQFPKEYTAEVSDNLDKLLSMINKVRKAYNKPMTVSSGWRPAGINSATKGAAKRSNHLLGLAVDIADPDGKLATWTIQNIALIASFGLFIEDIRYTKNWVHYQCVPPASGKRVFIPSSAPPPLPDRWDGVYPKVLDT